MSDIGDRLRKAECTVYSDNGKIVGREIRIDFDAAKPRNKLIPGEIIDLELDPETGHYKKPAIKL